MAATFLQMKTRIAANARRDLDTVVESTTEGALIGNAIVAAIKFYEKKANWWFLETIDTSLTIAASSNTLTLPSNFNKLIRFKINNGTRWITDGNGLDSESYDYLDRIDLDPNLTDIPSKYALFADTQIRVYPTANNTFNTSLTYYKKDATYPSADGDMSVLMGDESEELIYNEASSRYHGDTLHDEGKRAEYAAMATVEYKNIVRANNSRQTIYRTS